MSFKHTAVLFAAVFFLSGMTIKSEIVGYWELYQTENLSNSIIMKKRGKFIEFHSNGDLTGGRVGESPNKSGNWKLNKKTKVLTVTTPKYPRDSGDYAIIELSKKRLLLCKDSVNIYLDKGE